FPKPSIPRRIPPFHALLNLCGLSTIPSLLVSCRRFVQPACGEPLRAHREPRSVFRRPRLCRRAEPGRVAAAGNSPAGTTPPPPAYLGVTVPAGGAPCSTVVR